MPKRLPPTLQAKVFNVALGSVIKAERRKQHMYQKDLAKQTGNSHIMMNAFESGKTQLTIFKMHQICRILDVDATTMIERTLDLIAKTREELNDVKQIESQ